MIYGTTGITHEGIFVKFPSYPPFPLHRPLAISLHYHPHFIPAHFSPCNMASSSSSQNQALEPQFYYCHCGAKMYVRTSWTEINPARRFVKCPDVSFNLIFLLLLESAIDDAIRLNIDSKML